jgi:ectoine hydroxylase-related dioxygenase (phytanoyl-CoA dioxygenase family)
MYHFYNKVISQKLCDEINKRLAPYLQKDEQRHFVASGKKFFFSSMTGLLFLHKVLSEITSKINLHEVYKKPYIDHAYLLLKPGGGNATPAHQDRPFWTNKEAADAVSMITFWVALEDIDIDGGCLLVESSQVEKLSNFNDESAKVCDHENTSQKEGNFNYIVTDSSGKIAKSLKPIEMKKGDVLAFDAFEIHASADNKRPTHRLSFKVVFREGDGAINVNKFLTNFPIVSIRVLISNFWERVRQKLIPKRRTHFSR